MKRKQNSVLPAPDKLNIDLSKMSTQELAVVVHSLRDFLDWYFAGDLSEEFRDKQVKNYLNYKLNPHPNTKPNPKQDKK